MTRENNQYINKTIAYAYDAGGNITSKTEYAYTTETLGTATVTHTYGYGDTNWKDKLTSYDGNAITYDAIGNPLTYNGWSYTWEAGRQLAGMSNAGNTISYKYNDSGIRTSKTVNGVTTTYYLNGDSVVSETNGADTFNYYYDDKGDLIGFNLKNSTYPSGKDFYYIRNGQNDIIGILDSNGVQVVSYVYDSWGKLTSTTGTLASTVGVKNSYRYRGYRYDAETGLFCVGTRYYDPEVGRFINADTIDSTIENSDDLLSGNLFAYCTNNPVNYSDPDGTWKLPNWAKLAIGAAAIAIGVAATVATGGAAAPALIAALQVAGGSAAIGALLGGATGGWRGALDGACDGFMWGGLGAGASMAGKAIRVAKVGTSFGKLGTLIRYKKIGINWGRTTTHMLERMAERGMSKSLINWVVKNGKMLKQGADKYLYISKKGAVVMDGTGKLITGYGSSYFDSTMKSLVKQLF